MVQLEEVKDAELDQAQPGPLGSDYDSDDFVDTDSDLSTDDLDPHPTDPSSESLTDRLLALRDIIPPRTRRLLSNTLTRAFTLSKQTAWIGGKGLWVLTSGAIMLSVPYAVCMVEEQQIVEQEREMKAQEGAREALVPGMGTGSGGSGGGSGGSGL